jgi:hypothetical protein
MKQGLKDKLLALYTGCFEKYGDIKVRCTGVNSLPLDRIVRFQGDLKKLPDSNLLKLAKSMFIHGFVAPFMLWDDGGEWKSLDGDARTQTLCALRESGIPIPGAFPYSEIEADSEAEAREILLAITSSYNRFQKETLDAWVADLDPEVAETLSLVDTEIELAIASVSDDIAGSGDGEGDAAPNDLEKLIAQIAKLEKKTGNAVFTEIREFAEGLLSDGCA